MTNGNVNENLAPEDRGKTTIILNVVQAFESAGNPVPKTFICGQRGADARIFAFTLNVGDITKEGVRTAEWKGDLERNEMPNSTEREEIMLEIRRQEETSNALYSGHCVPRTTPQSPAR